MAALRRCNRTPLLMALFLLQSVGIVTAFTNDFLQYPPNSQLCLNKASNNSNCEDSDDAVMQKCWCNNGGLFVTNAATCIGTSDNTDLEAVYGMLSEMCSSNGSPIKVTLAQYMAAAGSPITSAMTTSASTAATTSTSAPSGSGTTGTGTNSASSPSITDDDDHRDKGSLSDTSKIGIIAGAAVAGIAIISMLVFFMFRMQRKKQKSDEDHPILGGSPMGRNPSGTELSQYAGHYAGSSYDYKAHDGAFGDPRWASTTRSDSYPAVPTPAFHPGQYQSPTVQQAQVFELSSEPQRTVIAEMPSEPMDRYSYSPTSELQADVPTALQKLQADISTAHQNQQADTPTVHQKCGPADYKQPAK